MIFVKLFDFMGLYTHSLKMICSFVAYSVMQYIGVRKSQFAIIYNRSYQ